MQAQNSQSKKGVNMYCIHLSNMLKQIKSQFIQMDMAINKTVGTERYENSSIKT
jgi:hypothetical protein